jgi:carboxypeptidase C (cathepsin A)
VNNCDDAAGFVVQFMKLFIAHHPEFKTTKFYIMGESFAGHYIPAIGA